MPTKIIRLITGILFFLFMLGSINKSTIWTMASFLTTIVMTIDEKTICQKFKLKNYYIFYAVWAFVVVMIMGIVFYFKLQGRNL